METYFVTLTRTVTTDKTGYAGGIDEIRSVQYIYQCISRGNSQEEALDNALKLANHDYPDSNYINIPDEETDNWRFIENYRFMQRFF